MKRHTALRRKTPLRARSWWQPRPSSRRRARVDDEGSAAPVAASPSATGAAQTREAVLAIVLRRDGGRCLAGPIIRARGFDPGCWTWANDGHEPLPRSAGGNPLDPAEVLSVCRPCHRWAHTHPAASYSLGLLVRRYPEADKHERARASVAAITEWRAA